MKYNPQKIEKKWQTEWEKNGTFKDYSRKEKFYALDMFPYPSGEGLHVGHPKGYIATDVSARFQQLRGKSVLHPMGWDAFGLPAENYALKNKIHPAEAVRKNIKRFKEQLQMVGCTYDWDREINTTDPEYYRWTQWIFLQMFEKGLAYESYEPINWCPGCKTGLANEDLENGKCERCGSEIEQRPMRQWVLKMTEYADQLLADLDTEELDWEKSIVDQQKNWIGRSEGAVVTFKIAKSKNEKEEGVIEVFTTRVDTIFGCTYIVIAPESKYIENIKEKIENRAEVEEYISQAKKKTMLQRTDLEKDKTGVELRGVVAIHPFTGEAVSVFVADYVLGSYGTGAVMAVPAHDERDFEFAKKYILPIRESVIQITGRPNGGTDFRRTAYGIIENKEGKILLQYLHSIDRYVLPGGGLEESETEKEGLFREIQEETGYSDIKILNRIGSVHANFLSLKGVERVVHSGVFHVGLSSEEKVETNWDEEEKNIGMSHEWVSVEEAKEKLKKDFIGDCVFSELFRRYMESDFCFTEDGILVDSGEFTGLTSQEAREKITEWLEKTGNGKRQVNYKMRDWVFSRQRYWGEPIPIVHCEKCGAVGVPEKDLPVVLPDVASYEPTGTGESPLAGIAEWVNTTCPKCGGPAKRETNTMPQWAGSSWYYLAYVAKGNPAFHVPRSEMYDEWLPVDLYVGGAEHATRHLLYARFWHKFLYDIGVVPTKEPFKKLVHVGLIGAADGRKMSKRWNNVINPDDVIAEFGADSLRLYEMFMGPFTQAIAWNTEGVSGVRRFLEKVWTLSTRTHADLEQTNADKDVERLLHKTIKKVTEDIENFRFNTAISSLMILVNRMEKESSLLTSHFSLLILLLSPFAPHIAEELWEKMGHATSIFLEKWPEWDEKLIVDETITLVVQVNGKVRDTLTVPANIAEEDAKTLALESEKVQKFIDGKPVRKTIFVKRKLVNVVV